MRKKRIKWVFITLGIALIGFMGYYFISIYTAVDGFNKSEKNSIFTTIENKNLKPAEIAPPKWEGKERVNILVLGGDSRGLTKSDEVPRSDSMMVISIEPNTKKALLLSILRDTYVKIPGHGEERINAALALGGPSLAMKTVSNLLGIPVQYYVYTDFKGFIGVIDAMGGVNLDVEKDMNYTDGEDDHIYDIHLKKGYQHLDGKTALQYVRFRHDALSDFARADRQRKFLTAISAEMQTASSFIKLPQILHAIDPYIETNISVSDMYKLGTLGYEAKAAGFIGQQIPPDQLLAEKTIRGAAVITTDPVKLKQYIQNLFVESLSGSPNPAQTVKPDFQAKSEVKATAKTTLKPAVKPTVKPAAANAVESAPPMDAAVSGADTDKPPPSIQPVLTTPEPASQDPKETKTTPQTAETLPTITVKPTDTVVE
jgi:LCP family protein required for cell wall assembly